MGVLDEVGWGKLFASCCAHLVVNFLDLDPYGEPWPVMKTFFGSARPKPGRVVLVVNDGLRQSLKMNGGWKVASLDAIVQRLGNAGLYERYPAKRSSA